MEILVSGSLAYDRIMDFPGRFSDHIMPDKLHMINVSFTVNRLTEKFGGTAGNIVFNVAFLALALALSDHGFPFGGEIVLFIFTACVTARVITFHGGFPFGSQGVLIFFVGRTGHDNMVPNLHGGPIGQVFP